MTGAVETAEERIGTSEVIGEPGERPERAEGVPVSVNVELPLVVARELVGEMGDGVSHALSVLVADVLVAPGERDGLEGDGADVYYVRVDEPLRPKLSPLHALTPTQRVVAREAAAGLTNREVAEKLEMSAETVKTHLKVVYRELFVSNRIELARVVSEE